MAVVFDPDHSQKIYIKNEKKGGSDCVYLIFYGGMIGKGAAD